MLTEDRTEFQDIGYQKYDISYREETEITPEEIKKHANAMKNGKAPGPGGVPIELIKYGPDKLFQLLAYTFNLFLRGEELPPEWKTAYISNLYKNKGDRKDCKNYRGLSVTNSICRVYGKIIKSRIEDCWEDAEDQSGFRTGRSCIDNVFCLKQTIEKRLEHNMETHMVFIDLQKAYDSVPLAKLWQVLEDKNIPPIYINAVRELYDDMTSVIKIGQKVTKKIKVTKGLRQGCCIAPTLFKIYLEGVLDIWKRKCEPMGVKIGDHTLYSLHFADDQVILAEDQDDIHYMLRKIDEEYTKWGLSINPSKTEYVVVGGEGKHLELGSKQIQNTDSYKYLGVNITNNGRNTKEIATRIGQGNSAIRQLNSILWNNHITRNTKIRIYKSIIESIATYGSELWVINKNDASKIKAMEMNYWRRCCQLTRRDRVRNTEIRERMGIDIDVLETIECKRLKWYGHVERMNDQRW
jgi:hypothetical protein